MKRNVGWRVAVLVVLIALAVAPLSRAQGTTQSPGTVELSPELSARTERVADIERGKSAFVNEMLAKFADAAAAKGYDAYWQKGQRNLLTRSADQLLALSERATDFDTFDKLVFRGFTVNALGDITQDLVFFPLAPCRLLDTRLATVAQYQGPKAPGTEIAFSVNDSLAVQGGNAAGCGTPSSLLDPPALSIVVTAIPTNTGQGNLRTYPDGGTIPTASVVNYQNGVVVAGGTITQSCTACTDELRVRNQGGGTTHIAVDVTGYFYPPTATALDCVTTAATSTTVAAGATFFADPPACAAGYTQVSVGCRSNAYNTANWAITGFYTPGAFDGSCWGTNISGGSATFQAYGRCCRIPGQ
jgi:hypothetical protein